MDERARSAILRRAVVAQIAALAAGCAVDSFNRSAVREGECDDSSTSSERLNQTEVDAQRIADDSPSMTGVAVGVADGAHGGRRERTLGGACFPRSLTPDARGLVPCIVVEARGFSGDDCGSVTL